MRSTEARSAPSSGSKTWATLRTYKARNSTMSIRKVLSISSFVCMMPLAACEEEDDPSLETDASDPLSVSDASATTGGDAATTDASVPAPVPSVDASAQSPDASVATNDASLPPSADAAITKVNFFLPTGEPTNTAEAVVELDRQNNVHTVYPAYVGGGAYYAFCPASGCSSASAAKQVRFETDGTVDAAMIALTSDGKPRVLLSTYLRLYYAECQQGCSERANWSLVELLNHGSDLAATGESLALDPAGHPRFLLHGRRNPYDFFTPKRTDTQLVTCDANCADAASWSYGVIASKEIWQGSHLRYDASGRAHVATTVFSYADDAHEPTTAYLSCSGPCNVEEVWTGVGLGAPATSLTDVVSIEPTVSLALTKAGSPRVASLIVNDQGKRSIGYAECDRDCTSSANWRGMNLWSEADTKLGAGLDLALDSKDNPVFAHTVNYDIVLTYCASTPCVAQGATWDSSYVEKGADIPADNIFLEWNCTVGAWFLHSPSLALTSDDQPRVGYQSRDISGGVSRPDPLKPACAAGTDMTFSRLGLLTSYVE